MEVKFPFILASIYTMEPRDVNHFGASIYHVRELIKGIIFNIDELFMDAREEAK